MEHATPSRYNNNEQQQLQRRNLLAKTMEAITPA
jgi:hypothetical protein